MPVLFNHRNFDVKGRRMSIAGVVNPKTNTISIGISVCSSLDQFSKKEGRRISAARAASDKPTVEIQMESETPLKDFHGAIKALFSKKEAILQA